MALQAHVVCKELGFTRPITFKMFPTMVKSQLIFCMMMLFALEMKSLWANANIENQVKTAVQMKDLVLFVLNWNWKI